MVRARLLACIVVAGCGGGGGFPDARIDVPPPGPGAVSLAWTVTDQNNQPIDCARIGATAVTISLHDLAQSGGKTEVFTCQTGSGTSQMDLTPGANYQIMFELDSGSGTVLQTAPALHGIAIESNQITALPPVTFAVQATGAMKLHLSANQAGGNCGAAPGGAAIDAMTISVQHGSTGPCEPLAFTIGAGATKPAGTYTIDCTTPVSAPCIESDQELSVATVPSDKYTFHIKGNVGGAACWSNNDQVTVPPLDATLTTTLNLGHAPSGTPGC